MAACVAILPALGTAWSGALACEALRVLQRSGSGGRQQITTQMIMANVPMMFALLMFFGWLHVLSEESFRNSITFGP